MHVKGIPKILWQFYIFPAATFSRHARWIATASNSEDVTDFSRNWNRWQGCRSRSDIEFRFDCLYPRVWKLRTGVSTFSKTRPDNVARLFTSYEDSRWKPVIKLTEISGRVRGPIKSGRKSKTMVDRDVKGRKAGKLLENYRGFLWLDVFGKSEALRLLSWRSFLREGFSKCVWGGWIIDLMRDTIIKDPERVYEMCVYMSLLCASHTCNPAFAFSCNQSPVLCELLDVC